MNRREDELAEAIEYIYQLKYQSLGVTQFHTGNENPPPEKNSEGQWSASFKYMQHNKKLKKQGMRKGAPDLTIAYHGNVLFIELKRNAEGKSPKGYLSKDQKEFQEHCKKGNNPYHVIRAVEEYIEIMESFLNDS